MQMDMGVSEAKLSSGNTVQISKRLGMLTFDHGMEMKRWEGENRREGRRKGCRQTVRGHEGSGKKGEVVKIGSCA